MTQVEGSVLGSGLTPAYSEEVSTNRAFRSDNHKVVVDGSFGRVGLASTTSCPNDSSRSAAPDRIHSWMGIANQQVVCGESNFELGILLDFFEVGAGFVEPHRSPGVSCD